MNDREIEKEIFIKFVKKQHELKLLKTKTMNPNERNKKIKELEKIIHGLKTILRYIWDKNKKLAKEGNKKYWKKLTKH